MRHILMKLWKQHTKSSNLTVENLLQEKMNRIRVLISDIEDVNKPCSLGKFLIFHLENENLPRFTTANKTFPLTMCIFESPCTPKDHINKDVQGGQLFFFNFQCIPVHENTKSQCMMLARIKRSKFIVSRNKHMNVHC